MGTRVQELKHAAKLQEWTARVAECRGSGVGVKVWCREQGIALKTYYNWERQIVKQPQVNMRLRHRSKEACLCRSDRKHYLAMME